MSINFNGGTADSLGLGFLKKNRTGSIQTLHQWVRNRRGKTTLLKAIQGLATKSKSGARSPRKGAAVK